MVLNRIRFSAETHTLQINATDSVGSVGTFIYTFVGERPPGEKGEDICQHCWSVPYEILHTHSRADLKLIVSPKYVVVEEDGRSSANIVVTKEGYSFGEVQFTLVPLTYSQFESEIGKNLDLLFPFRPIPHALSKPLLHQNDLCPHSFPHFPVICTSLSPSFFNISFPHSLPSIVSQLLISTHKRGVRSLRLVWCPRVGSS